MATEWLRALIDAELDRPVPPPVAALAAQLAARARGGAAAVLYYGSTLRDDTLGGVLDFYVLLDHVGAWPGTRLATWANAVLPPNVGYYEQAVDGLPLRAKVAVMSLQQFAHGVSSRTLDTTLWARFSQPCACVWSRSPADRVSVAAQVRQAVVTAGTWAAALGPASAPALDYWRALYAQTYGAELRVEKGSRSSDIVARDAERYASLLPAAWQAAQLGYATDSRNELQPQFAPGRRERVLRRWGRRKRLGKLLNLLRLLKAALTFDGAMDYVAWKVERHSGVRLQVSPWQRRFPLLAAPGVYLRLRRLGVLR